jgi:hypothetical protein
VSVEWYTPPEVFDALRISFDLDPAAPPGGLPWVPAEQSYSRADDGLSQPWHGRVWLNPPYGRETGPWLERLSAHGNGLALVFARTDTRWFHAACNRSTAICFIAGRLRFYRLDGPAASAPAPSVLLAYGLPCAVALADADLGQTLVVPHPAMGGADMSRRHRRLPHLVRQDELGEVDERGEGR